VGLLRCLCAWSRWNAELGERRQLEQIEQALRADDPRFCQRRPRGRPAGALHAPGHRCGAGFLIGVGLLAGVVINVILIAVAGFVVMLACSMWAVTSSRRMTGTTGRVPAKARRSAKKRRAAKARRCGKQAGSGLMGGWRSAREIASRAAANPRLPAAVLSPRARGGHYRLLTARQRG
jgi:predicted lipid-binding transport protein (Tim44 family)